MNDLKNKEESARFRAETEKKEAQAAADALNGKSVKISAKAGQNGRLFGSVTTKEVAEALKAQFKIEVDRRKISISDIKAQGTYEGEIKLLSGITAKINVVVAD
jgi:large subunit ribosomal protein L9